MEALARNGSNVTTQVAASALSFGAVHAVWGLMKGSLRASLGAMIATGSLGLLLALAYASHRSLAPCVASHFLINLFAEPGLVLAALYGEMGCPKNQHSQVDNTAVSPVTAGPRSRIQLPVRKPAADIDADVDVSRSDTHGGVAVSLLALLLGTRVFVVAAVPVVAIDVLVAPFARVPIVVVHAFRWRRAPIIFLLCAVSSLVGSLFGVRRSGCQGQCTKASCKDRPDDALHGVVSLLKV